MSVVRRIEDVLTFEEIAEVKGNVRSALGRRYKYCIENAEIAIGRMVNGIALVYVGERQESIDFVERNCSAQLAINSKGEFVKIPIGPKNACLYGFETYDEDSDKTLGEFRLRRLFTVVKSENVSTDEFDGWSTDFKAASISEYIICESVIYDGRAVVDSSAVSDFLGDSGGNGGFDGCSYLYGDNSAEAMTCCFDEDKKHRYCCLLKCWGWNRSEFGKSMIPSGKATSFLIKSRYLLLYDNLREYFYDDVHGEMMPYEHDASSYLSLLKRYKMSSDDLFENRYGVYDINAKSLIIHVGEMRRACALISGFRRLDFVGSGILTYDIFDMLASKGVPYSPELSGIDNPRVVAYSVFGRMYLEAHFKVTEYWGDARSRSGINAGEWYLIREGKHAGRTLCWLLANGFYRDVVRMINQGYISFDNFNHFTYPSVLERKQRDAVWLALDGQKLFKDVDSIDDCLELKPPFDRDWIAKHSSIAIDEYSDEPCFEELVAEDTDYLVGLIDRRCLFVSPSVVAELQEIYEGNGSYLSKLKRIERALDEYQADIHDLQERARLDMESMWDE